MLRSSGVLLNISSLPGEYGIGGFSIDAKNFAEYISSMGFHWWQILPLTTIGEGNSPYCGLSAFAGNFLYLDPYSFESGLLTDEEKVSAKYQGDIYLTDYAFAYYCKRDLLQKAYGRITDTIKNNVEYFRAQNSYWLEDYALFMALREENGNKPWYQWEDKLKYRDSQAIQNAKDRLSDRIFYYCFEQYEFFRQWKNLKLFINNLGVNIFGDMPIYVCYDSADVWAHPEIFQLNDNLEPLKVSGVPPDYFCAEGQRWGNPLYDYQKMKENNYEWLIKRILHNLNLYDMLRIDHFRGFYKYWAIPAASPGAKQGEWLDGPQYAIWEELQKHVVNPNIIAEDLGIIDDDVKKYLQKTGFYGMRVMQFAFDGDPCNIHLPHNYNKKCVGYTGTHDNDTTLGWLLNLPEQTRNYALEYVHCNYESGWAGGGGDCQATKCFIKTLLSSACDLAIIPMQDLSGYGGDTRMNTPGKATGNWEYRTNYSAMESVDISYMRKLNNLYGRNVWGSNVNIF
ncbi:MAG: 4-alpha-glucanotransferase [Christensenellales bacterium]|jgi:4-alpha-glucanotransferase|nr:4-alpha-glucanotransferase [Clostridiales bacterium]